MKIEVDENLTDDFKLPPTPFIAKLFYESKPLYMLCKETVTHVESSSMTNLLSWEFEKQEFIGMVKSREIILVKHKLVVSE